MALFLEEKILRRFFKEGYYTAPEIDSLTWSFGNITGTPTTLAGYGITDAATSAQGALADTALQPSDTIDGGTF